MLSALKLPYACLTHMHSQSGSAMDVAENFSSFCCNANAPKVTRSRERATSVIHDCDYIGTLNKRNLNTRSCDMAAVRVDALSQLMQTHCVGVMAVQETKLPSHLPDFDVLVVQYMGPPAHRPVCTEMPLTARYDHVGHRLFHPRRYHPRHVPGHQATVPPYIVAEVCTSMAQTVGTHSRAGHARGLGLPALRG